jgi:membrane protein YqaA with SNARE-associated domain
VADFFRTISEALVSYGPWGLLLLAFLDSAGIPVGAGMDAIVLLVAAKAPERAYLAAALAVLGSVAGNVLLFTAARKGRKWVRKEEEAVTPGEPRRFERWFREYGLVTIFVPAIVPVIPLPLKVFVISAGMMHTRLLPFLTVILAARLVRYFGEAYLGIKLGQESMPWLKAHMWEMTGFAFALCIGVYLVVLWQQKHRAGHRPHEPS